MSKLESQSLYNKKYLHNTGIGLTITAKKLRILLPIPLVTRVNIEMLVFF